MGGSIVEAVVEIWGNEKKNGILHFGTDLLLKLVRRETGKR